MRSYCFFLLTALAIQPADAATITLTADEWCPYNCAEDDAKPGYVVELTRLIFEPRGDVVRYVVRPWARALKETSLGNRTAVIAVSQADNLDDYLLTDTVGVERLEFFTRVDDTWTFAGLPSLGERTLGVARDYTYGQPLDGFLADSPARVMVIHGETPFAAGLAQLRRGALDVLIEDGTVARYAARASNTPLRSAGLYGEPMALHLGFSRALPSSAEQIRVFNEGLGRLRASGQLARVLTSYGVADWTP